MLAKAALFAGAEQKDIVAGIKLGQQTITTTSYDRSLFYSNGRNVDRTSNGNLWAMVLDLPDSSPDVRFICSEDNGRTWTETTGFNFTGDSLIRDPMASFFIDEDDFAHVVYKDPDSGGDLQYRRGTPNADQTDWIWSSAYEYYGVSTVRYPDVVAHRKASGEGWWVHIVHDRTGGGVDRVMYFRLDIDANGGVTQDHGQYLSSDWGNEVPKFASIDFQHTGDGKTPAVATPEIYFAWSAGETGGSAGLRYVKAEPDGADSWSTISSAAHAPITTNYYIPDDLATARWINCMFDGTAVMVVGWIHTGGGGNRNTIWEIDPETGAEAGLFGSTTTFKSGSATYDDKRNIWFFGVNPDNDEMRVVRWTRTDDSIKTLVPYPVSNDAPGTNTIGHISAKRGHSNGQLDLIFMDSDASPYNVYFGGVT